MGGFIGSLLIGAFASEVVGGFGPSWALFGKQTVAAILIAVYSGGLSILMLKGIDAISGGKLSPTHEQIEFGLDKTIHGETAYRSETGGEISEKSAYISETVGGKVAAVVMPTSV